MDVPRGNVRARSPGLHGGRDERSGSLPGVWPAPGHGAQDAGLLGAPRIPTPGATRRPRLEPFTGVIDAYSRHNERDRRFRDVVLRAYRSRCALCELDVQVDGRQIGIEAAHIKRHSEGGPPRVENGMVLCVLHHKFFDSGLFTVLSDLTVQVGGLAVGDSVEESLNKYGGSVLPVIPDCPDLRPASRFLEWHKRAVFKASSSKSL